MKNITTTIGFVIIVGLASSACSTRQIYYSGQAWQRNECTKILDDAERERCMQSTETTFEEYKRKTEDKAKP